jgi:hypothetical protein
MRMGRRGLPGRALLFSQRLDPVWLGVATVAVSALAFLFRLWGADGHLAAPLDDTFIHFQYARQLAEGHPYEYNTGDPPSSGESAFIYPFLLAPAFLLGLDGMRVLLFADLLLLAAHIVAVILFYRLGVRLGGRALGLLCGVLLLLDGRLLFAYVSGMETGLYAAALVALFWVWLRDVPLGRLGWLVGVAIFTALLRPEGHGIAVLVCGLTLVYLWRTRGLRPPHALVVLPALVGLVPYVVNVAMTGEWQYNTAASKSLFYVPHTPLHETLSLTVGWAINAIKNIYLGLEIGRSPFPLLAAPLAIWGAGVALMGRRVHGQRDIERNDIRFFHALLVLTFLAGVGLALLLPPIQFHRYYMPYDFIFYLYLAIGAFDLVGRLARRRVVRVGSRVSVRRGPVGAYRLLASIALVVMLVPQFVSYLFAVSDSTRDIYYQQMAFSVWVRRYTPADARLGVNDTGAHKYLSDRYVIDLIGLTNNYMRGAYFGGWGTVFDRLARMPEGQRPTHLLVHPNLFLNGIEESLSQQLLQPVYQISVQNPIITAGPTESLYTIDWGYALLDPSSRYLERKDADALDTVDVGDLESERAHGYKTVGRLPSISEPKSIVTTAHYDEAEGFSLSESGRRHSGWEEFRVRSAAGQPLVIVGRAKLNPGVGQRVLVMANGREVGLWEVRNERDNQWQEYLYTIPAEFVTSDLTTLRLDATFDPGGPGFASYRYWVFGE